MSKIYEISQDLGDDPQDSLCAMYRDTLPERHRIDEIDDGGARRDVVHWMQEEDARETDAHRDPLEEPTSCTEEED